MKFRVSTLVNLMLSIVLVVSIAANFTGAVDYDPWLDVTDDGYGGIDDIVSTAEHFGASGDPTKLCNITNWPISNDVTVWFSEPMALSSFLYSGWYEASGFRYLHILARGSLLAGAESVEITVYGRVKNPSHSTYSQIPAYTFTLSFGSTYFDIILAIPSGSFRFSVATDATTDCQVYLGFYLT